MRPPRPYFNRCRADQSTPRGMQAHIARCHPRRLADDGQGHLVSKVKLWNPRDFSGRQHPQHPRYFRLRRPITADSVGARRENGCLPMGYVPQQFTAPFVGRWQCPAENGCTNCPWLASRCHRDLPQQHCRISYKNRRDLLKHIRECHGGWVDLGFATLVDPCLPGVDDLLKGPEKQVKQVKPGKQANQVN